jgi:hypothetical protein
MQKSFVLGAVVVLLLLLAGCASTPGGSGSSGSMSRGLSGVPSFVNDAYLNASASVMKRYRIKAA